MDRARPRHPGLARDDAEARRGRVAEAADVLGPLLGIAVDDAEVRLLVEARRRGGELDGPALEVLAHPATGEGLPPATCSICGAPGQLRSYGDTGHIRVVVCPGGHGVISRA